MASGDVVMVTMHAGASVTWLFSSWLVEELFALVGDGDVGVTVTSAIVMDEVAQRLAEVAVEETIA